MFSVVKKWNFDAAIKRKKAQGTGPNLMALLTVSTESALTEAGNSVCTSNVFHRNLASLCMLLSIVHSELIKAFY